MGKENLTMSKANMKPVQMYEIELEGSWYTVPGPVVEYLERVQEEVRAAKDSRAADEKTIDRRVQEHASMVLNYLFGKSGMHDHGENLLKYDRNYQVPLPPNIELDDGSKMQPFESEVYKRIIQGLTWKTKSIAEEYGDPFAV